MRIVSFYSSIVLSPCYYLHHFFYDPILEHEGDHEPQRTLRMAIRLPLIEATNETGFHTYVLCDLILEHEEPNETRRTL